MTYYKSLSANRAHLLYNMCKNRMIDKFDEELFKNICDDAYIFLDTGAKFNLNVSDISFIKWILDKYEYLSRIAQNQFCTYVFMVLQGFIWGSYEQDFLEIYILFKPICTPDYYDRLIAMLWPNTNASTCIDISIYFYETLPVDSDGNTFLHELIKHSKNEKIFKLFEIV